MLLSAALAVQKVPKDGEGVKSGPIGLAMILLLCVAVYFLCKSMSKHLKRVRDDFPVEQTENAQRESGDSVQPAEVDAAAEPAAEAAASPPTAEAP
jgi:hypothetical protein